MRSGEWGMGKNRTGFQRSARILTASDVSQNVVVAFGKNPRTSLESAPFAVLLIPPIPHSALPIPHPHSPFRIPHSPYPVFRSPAAMPLMVAPSA